jgi:NADH-quinone oxidoreductase subunit D
MVLNMGPRILHARVLRLSWSWTGDYHQSGSRRGLLHRGDEKIAENMTYTQFIPYTDRLDYLRRWRTTWRTFLRSKSLLGIEKQLPPRASSFA